MDSYGELVHTLRHIIETYPLAGIIEVLEKLLTENDNDFLEWKIKIKVKCKKED